MGLDHTAPCPGMYAAGASFIVLIHHPAEWRLVPGESRCVPLRRPRAFIERRDALHELKPLQLRSRCLDFDQ